MSMLRPQGRPRRAARRTPARLRPSLGGRPRDCIRCGNHSALGSHRAYVGAGVVLRCPGCGMVSVRITTLPDRHVVEFSGAWKLAVPR
jgi:hypothetical protein